MSKSDQSRLFLTLDALIPADHTLTVNWNDHYHLISSVNLIIHFIHIKAKEKGAESALWALVLQFHEDLSDREMERFIQEKTFLANGSVIGVLEKRYQIIVILVSFVSALVLNG